MHCAPTRWLAASTAGVWLLLGASPAAADSAAQRSFAEATRYTVKIEASTEFSFIERDSGAWSGAGFLVDRARRWVLTNAHVAGYVDTTLQASFKGQPNRGARALFVDNLLDLAVIELEPGAVPQEATEARLACAKVPAVGTDLGAFGHPLGYAFTATRGIMAGITRSEGYPMIQTDTPISPGNSGGPLIDLATGEVVGINTASIGDKRAQNVNFAVMITEACRVLELLRDDGFSLRAGDSVLGIDGDPREFVGAAEFLLALRGRSGNVPLRVLRNGREEVLNTALVPSLQHVGRRGLAISGVVFAARKLAEITSADEAGVLIVHQVEPGSSGDLHQINYGFQVVSIDGREITTLSQLQRLAVAAQREDRALRLILRAVTDDSTAEDIFHLRELPVDSVRWYPR